MISTRCGRLIRVWVGSREGQDRISTVRLGHELRAVMAASASRNSMRGHNSSSNCSSCIATAIVVCKLRNGAVGQSCGTYVKTLRKRRKSSD